METSYISFKEEYPFDSRILEATKILKKYPDRKPIIVETFKQNFFGSDLPKLDKRKYLVPEDITVGQFLYIIRKRMNIKEHEGLFIFFGDNHALVSTSDNIMKVYNDHREKDLFLYAYICKESVFG